MSAPDTPREARKKLLLLEAQLHRLDLMQAREAWQAATRDGLLGATLPASVATGLKTRTGQLLLTALPLLLRGGRIGRWVRRAALVAGGGAAALALLNRWLQRSDEPLPAETPDEKNPGRDRD